MGQSDWEELLSAYADGAVTPAERSAVEALLETTPDARRALNEIRSLSQLLKAQPRETAPANLRGDVMKRIQPHVTPATVAAAKRFRSYRREWLAGLSAIALTVLAAGLLSVQFRPESAAVGSNTWFDVAPATAPTSPVIADADFRFDAESRAAANFAVSVDSTEKMLAASDQPAANETKFARGLALESGRADRLLDRSPTTSLSAGAVTATVAPPRPEAIELDALNGVMAADNAEDVERLKEVLPYLRLKDENGQAIGNVELVVVDAQRVANQFQVLLMKNGVTTVEAQTVDFDGDLATREESRPKSAAPPTSGTNDLFAVYTEAPGEPLSKTLEELIKQREVLAMRLQPPLQVPAWPEQETATAAGKSTADRKLNLKQLNDAYITQQLDDGLAALESESVSATDAIAAARGERPSSSSSAFGNAPRRAMPPEELARMPKLAENVAPSAASQAPALGLESNQNLASFNTLVKLQVPASADEAILSNRVQAEMAQNARRNVRMNSAMPAAPDDFVQMRSRFARTAPDTVRVLFVLHPATNSTPMPASAPAPR